MPLEKFFSGENINIKDLTIENPEKEEELWFDPEKEMTEEDWQKIKELVEGPRYDPRNELPFAVGMEYLSNAKILSPERFAEFNIDKENILADIKKQLKGRKASDSDTLWSLSRQNLSNFKQAFPEKAPELEEYYVWDKGKKRLMELRQKKDWGEFGGVAYDLKILHPERTAELGLDDETWNGMKEELAKMEGQYQYGFTQRAATMRLLYPEKFDELEIDLGQKEWAKNLLRKLRGGNASPFFRYAANLKILAAEEAYIDDNGMIVVNMRKKQKPELEPETPPMPEKRNF